MLVVFQKRCTRPRLLAASATVLALLTSLSPATAGAAGTATSYAYLSVSRSGPAVYVNGLVKQSSPAGVIRSPKRTVMVQRLLGNSWQNVIARQTGWDGFFSVGYLSPPSYSYRLVVAASGSAAATTSATAASPVLGRALATGQSLIAGATEPNTMLSPSGVFNVSVDAGEVQLNQVQGSYGALVWLASAKPNPYRLDDKTRLTMQSDGNLVLRSSSGTPLWSSHTSGTGSHNAMYLQNDGNLVVYTAAGHAVWQSGTGRIFLLSGSGLAPGQQLIDRLVDAVVPTSRMTMQRNGDLVITFGSTVTWHSNTHVAGSRAYLSGSGALDIISPASHLVWQSSTRGANGQLLMNICGQANLSTISPYSRTNFPAGPDRICA